jgi:hypothetical protein
VTDARDATGRPPAFARFRASMRQRRYPVEFRIPEPAWPTDLRERMLALVAQDTTDGTGGDTGGSGEGAAVLDDGYLADAVTSVWRAHRKLTAETDGSRSVQQARKHLESTWRALADTGVVVQGHDHAPFDPGQALEMVAQQPEPGLSRATVIETISPTIYINGRHVQMGKVIVGSPEGNSE